jgi:asparagine synthase (glutamine-hydrolysing)
MENLHLYDVCRADRTISSNGLELRVPFLDNKVIDLALALDEEKVPSGGYEKKLLRLAFENYLPQEVIWRRKEGFSDGVSGIKKSWFQC